MNNERIQQLLSNYIADSLTPEEFQELKSCINITDDERLHAELTALWENFPPEKNIYTTELDQAFHFVEKQTHFQHLRRPVKILTRIAAILLLPLICTVATYLYMDKQVQPFINNKVIIQAENGHRAGVTLPDGTKVQLNSGSFLTYPQKFGQKTREVELSGEAFFEVTKNAEKKFIVHTEYLNIEVLGTTFNVNSYEKENTIEMVLLTGKVKINTNQAPFQTLFVKPNEKISYDKQSGLLEIRKTEAKFETAWLRQELIFRSEKLENVFHKLERKYGVSIRTEKFEQNEDLFTGSFGNNEITDILNILKSHYNFKYKVLGNEIVIYGENK